MDGSGSMSLFRFLGTSDAFSPSLHLATSLTKSLYVCLHLRQCYSGKASNWIFSSHSRYTLPPKRALLQHTQYYTYCELIMHIALKKTNELMSGCIVNINRSFLRVYPLSYNKNSAIYLYISLTTLWYSYVLPCCYIWMMIGHRPRWNWNLPCLGE